MPKNEVEEVKPLAQVSAGGGAEFNSSLLYDPDLEYDPVLYYPGNNYGGIAPRWES